VSKQRTWTDERLRDAIASSTSYSMVLRTLGLRSGSLGYLKRQIDERGLDTSHFVTKTPFHTAASDEALRRLVPTVQSSTELLMEMGVELQGNNFRRVRQRISELGLDTSHFTRARPDRLNQSTRWSNEELREAVKSSRSIAQTIRALGLVAAGGNYDHVQRRIRELELDISHFTGQAWNVGGAFKPTGGRALDTEPQVETTTDSRRPKRSPMRALRLGRTSAGRSDPGRA